MNEFKLKSLEDRQRSFKEIKNNMPNRIPIIVYPYDDKCPNITNHKFIVPEDYKLSTFLRELNKYLIVEYYETYFIFTETNILCSNSKTLLEIYNNYKNEDDNFLYLYYTKENAFGFK